MIKILFICHGNICRSPMAEFIMKDLVQKAGLAAEFHIESAATPRGSSRSCWSTRGGAATWPTRGIRVISRRRGAMCWRAVRRC